MKNMLLTKSNLFIIGPIATLLGVIMNGIYMFLDGTLSIQNVAICIILFTIIVNLALLPMTIKQQKSSKLQAYMNPELQALQKKYKGKTDQASQMKMYEEQKALQAKYGVSMTGMCGTLLIQMPILLAMYQVILKIPDYIKSVYNVYSDLMDKLLVTSGAQEFLSQYATQARVDFDKSGFTKDTIVDVLYNFRPSNWTELAKQFPDLQSVIESTSKQTEHINSFLGINIADTPMSIITSSWAEKAWLPLLVGLAIPILAGLLQWISTKLMPTQTTDTTNNDNNAMASSMKTMNTVMPLMSVFFCFTFSVGIGIYWVAGSLIRCVTQIIANKHMEKIDVEEMIKKNLEKYNEKRVKQGLRPESISNVARQNIKNMNVNSEEKGQSEESRQKQQEKRLKNIQESTEYYNNTAKPGSLAAKARMVQQYNEKNTKKK